MNPVWWLPTANFLICGFGAAICLYTLVSGRVDTEHWRRLFFISLAGLGFVNWLIFGIVYYPDLKPELLISRILFLLAMLFAVSAMRESDKKIACSRVVVDEENKNDL